MRILVVTPTYFPIVGGAEIGIYEIYRRIAKRHEVRILSPDLIGDEIQDDYADGPFVSRFRDRWSVTAIRGHRIFGGIIPPFSFSYLTAVGRQVKEFQPDVINMHYAVPGGPAAIVIQKRFGIPVVLSLVGRDVPGPNTPGIWQYYVRAVASRCAGTVFISDYCMRQVFREKTPGSTRTIPYGVDLDKFGASDKPGLRARMGLPQDAVVLLSVQRLAPEKRVDIVLRAVASLAREKQHVFLAIVGAGPCMDELSSLCDTLGLSDTVHFYGRASDEDLAMLYKAADIFVFHSTYETFGVVLAEALAAGLPAVTVNTTAIPELVQDGRNGFLVPPYDHAAMADRIQRLLSDTNLRDSMSHEARNLASRYDWNKIAGEYEEALAKAMTGFTKD